MADSDPPPPPEDDLDDAPDPAPLPTSGPPEPWPFGPRPTPKLPCRVDVRAFVLKVKLIRFTYPAASHEFPDLHEALDFLRTLPEVVRASVVAIETGVEMARSYAEAFAGRSHRRQPLVLNHRPRKKKGAGDRAQPAEPPPPRLAVSDPPEGDQE